jgi:hypothetical protein
MNVPFMFHEPLNLRIKGEKPSSISQSLRNGIYDRHHIDIIIYHQQSERQDLIVNAALFPGRAGRLIGIDIYNIVYILIGPFSQGQGRPIGHLPTIQNPENL